MKKRVLKAMSAMLVAATLVTGVGFNEVVNVKAETVYDENGYHDADNYDEDENEDSEQTCTGYYFSMKYAHTFTNADPKISGKAWYDQKSSKIDFINNKAKQFSIEGVYVKANGKKKYVSSDYYTVKVKKLSVNKNGYGKYKITVTLNDKIDNDYYTVTGNKVMEKNVTVVPDIEAIEFMIIQPGSWNNKKSKADWKTTHEYYLNMRTNILFKGIDGVEVVISPKKDGENSILHFSSEYKKISVNNEYGTKKTWVWPRKKILNNYYISLRSYSSVNGKKVYSDWYIRTPLYNFFIKKSYRTF